jgi:bifunctional non-homologous end joining protein LigD
LSLEQYKKKRDFSKTSEPGVDVKAKESQHRFVVQEHHASHLHYDFRLEMDGVLKSWAVPKGPPPSSGIRRLAVQTEDHPVEYLTFHGTIPEGNYGAGEMAIWDSGTFESVADDNPVDGVNRGKLELLLHGKRLVGKYDLIRTDDEKRNWIFIKAKDQPSSNGSTVPANNETKNNTKRNALPGSKDAAMPSPSAIEPMLAVTGDASFNDPDWQFEIKWDGYRALTYVRSDGVEVYSRNHQPLLNKVKEFSDMRRCFDCNEAIIDGEIVALDDKGLAHFQELQDRLGFGLHRKPANAAKSKSTSESFQLVYMVFDILYYNGYDISGATLVDRRQLLKNIVVGAGPVRFSDHVEGYGEQLFARLKELGVEGMVAKRADSKYMQSRSPNWIKVKTINTMDVVIAGYTESQAVRRPFGALVMGEYQNGKLESVGHVGTGFDQKMMSNLMTVMGPLLADHSPFEHPVNRPGKVNWLKPKLVCEVKYASMTTDHQLRQPVFLHLRPDKPAEQSDLESQTTPKVPEASPTFAVPGVLLAGSTLDKDVLTLESSKVSLTHLNKIYWPKAGTTKRDLLRYYSSISHYLLPHLKDRPLVVQRYPDGVGGEGFFRHDMNGGRAHVLPEYLTIYSVEESSGTVAYAVCNNLPSLLYMVNLGSIPLHCWNITTQKPDWPDRIVFDFDPPDDLAPAIQAAHLLKSVLDEIGLKSFVKTSGANGLHVYVPIAPLHGSDAVMAFAKAVGEAVVSTSPDLVTLERRIKSRGTKKVYLDCVQNRVGKTVVAPYSVRAQEMPTVSTPLTWDELGPTLKMNDFSIDNVTERANTLGDLFADVLANEQKLSIATDKLVNKYRVSDDQRLAEAIQKEENV